MKVKFIFAVDICIPILSGLICTSVNAQSGKWTSKPFGQKIFIENKGQFPAYAKASAGKVGKNANDSTEILFASSSDGVELYFTATGLTYKHDELIQMTEQEIEKAAMAGKVNQEGEEERKMMKSVPLYLSIEWLGSNTDVEIIPEEPVSFYYTYGGAYSSAEASAYDKSSTDKSVKAGRDATTTIKANAYKKIIYKNLYPNIDVEYFFPSDSGGIKYSLILHSGADMAVTKMKYENTENISLDFKGNIVIKSSFGEFIDHAPQTFYADNHQAILSSFSLTNNIVSFLFPFPISFGEGMEMRHIIIDPWTSIPTFTGYNAAYDVNYDMSGNVYIYGSYNPFQLAKLDSAGNVKWVFNATGLGDYSTGHDYGDFAVDETNGTSYLVEGWTGSSARVFKVNTLGVQTGTFPGDPNFGEMWRAEYSPCNSKIVIAGGGTNANFQAAMLDTNLLNITPINVLSTSEPYHDMSLLTIDNSGSFCYMASTRSLIYPTLDNVMVKCSIPNLVPVAFSVNTGHAFYEWNSVNYIGDIINSANGLNGMACSPSWLYTYDSDSLKRWNKNTGAFIGALDVFPSAPVIGTNNQIMVSWGGLTVDECDNIYVGLVDSIKEYNTSFSLINTFALPDTVYDVKLGQNNKLYACGKGFVTEINITPNNTTVTFTQTPASCGSCDGQATVSALSCGGNTSGFNYSWNTSPVQTTQTATGLCPGNYTVTVTTNCFNSFTDSIQLTGSAAYSTNNPQTICSGESYTFNVHTYTTAGTYYDTLTAVGGCDSIIITQLAVNPAYSINNPQTICNGGDYVLNSHTYTTTGTYYDTLSAVNSCDSIIITQLMVNPAYSTNNPQAICNGGSYTFNSHTYTTAGTYYDTLSSVNGCDSIIVTQLTVVMVFSSNNIQSICNGSTYTINSHAYTTTGNYHDTLTSVGGCDSIIATQLTVNPLPSVYTGNDTTIVSGSPVQLNAAAAATSFLWSTGDTAEKITVSPTTNTTYYVTATDANGCQTVDSVRITIEDSQHYISVPNIFSPNGDGNNDFIKVHGLGVKEFKLLIYDRWGEMIFSATGGSAYGGETVEWDGTFKGKPLNSAVFIYMLDATFTNATTFTEKGNITLVK